MTSLGQFPVPVPRALAFWACLAVLLGGLPLLYAERRLPRRQGTQRSRRDRIWAGAWVVLWLGAALLCFSHDHSLSEGGRPHRNEAGALALRSHGEILHPLTQAEADRIERAGARTFAAIACFLAAFGCYRAGLRYRDLAAWIWRD